MYHTAHCGTYVHVHVASIVNGFGIWSTFGDTVLYVCVPNCHGHVCKSVVMMSCSQRVCSYGYT